MIYVTRKSQSSGIERTKCLDVTESAIKEYENGSTRMVQDIFPHLTPDQREFIMTGITAEEWDEIFGVNDGDW